MGLFPHGTSKNPRSLTRSFLTVAPFVLLCICHRIYYVLYSGNPWLKEAFNGSTFLVISFLETFCIFLHSLVSLSKEAEFRKLIVDLRMGAGTKVKKFSTVYTVVSITWLVVYQLGYGSSITLTGQVAFNFVLILFNQIMVHLIGLQYCSFLLIVREQYDRLVDYLLLGYGSDFRSTAWVKVELEDYCSTLLEHHSSLNRTANLINSLYQKQMATLLANLTLYFIGWAYYIFTDAWDSKYTAATFRALHSMWILSFIFTIVHSCEITKYSVSRILGILPCDDGFVISRSLVIYSAAIFLFNVFLMCFLSYKVPCPICESEVKPRFGDEMLLFSNTFRQIVFLINLILAGTQGEDYYRRLFPKMTVIDSDENTQFPRFVAVITSLLLASRTIVFANSAGLRPMVEYVIIILDSIDHIKMYYIVAQYGTLIELITQQVSIHIQHLCNSSSKTTKELYFEIDMRISDILELCTNLDEEMGYQILFTICYFFFHFLTQTYFTYEILKDSNRLSSLGAAIPALFSLLLIFSICQVCQRLYTKAEKFNTELFRLMRENKELCKNEKLQLYVTMKQTVNFTACGFFTLGYPLVTSIIAAATTYLVILVQFSMPPSKS